MIVDSWAGPARVEWDDTAALTPHGQMPFFIEYLKVAGLFDGLVADCPLTYRSPNAPKKRDVLAIRMVRSKATIRRSQAGPAMSITLICWPVCG